ncbi:hypothetical protein A5844_001175 [Enterococcus sp. 10A9_DIV0425]|uniref:Gram-positive cocci surface proteins LPxTG domain-containing protein n=1 Tax=Candidatus Enterococcus wittei TaxID=1987383 RepID=A0A242K057_9ENTE|nr:LPXTG cell wall anchor domain-containing protein [Enterococcus sp. 10A9_DIV0425]OTP11041.1 hypothetical protein A5844_001175 [Enterococcus sp. 10A9_DIV0425]THE10065.1 LPXTG cell wall anchor domain-containing protein [Enterococcus hirae]
MKLVSSVTLFSLLAPLTLAVNEPTTQSSTNDSSTPSIVETTDSTSSDVTQSSTTETTDSSIENNKETISEITVRYWDADPEKPFRKSIFRAEKGKKLNIKMISFDGWEIEGYVLDRDEDHDKNRDESRDEDLETELTPLEEDQKTLEVKALKDTYTLDIYYKKTDVTTQQTQDTVHTEASTETSESESIGRTNDFKPTIDSIDDSIEQTDEQTEPELSIIEEEPSLPAGEELTLTKEDLIEDYFDYSGNVDDLELTIESEYVYAIHPANSDKLYHSDLDALLGITRSNIIVMTEDYALENGYKKSDSNADAEIEAINQLKDGRYKITATDGTQDAEIILTIGDLKSVNQNPGQESSDTDTTESQETSNTTTQANVPTLPKTGSLNSNILTALGFSILSLGVAILIKNRS